MDLKYLFLITFMMIQNSFVSFNNGAAAAKSKSSKTTSSIYSTTAVASSSGAAYLSNGPRILTKAINITSHEHYTVILPCQVVNLPSEMHVIWQHGRRGSERDQTVLTIGSSQIIDNFRVRAITNESFNNNNNNYDASASSSAMMITNVNLEIRKLQLSDAGWYECQLPTKPTQYNYIHLEVLGAPKIEASLKHPRLGEPLELTCTVKNMPSDQEIQWQIDNRKIETIDMVTINDISFKSTQMTTKTSSSTLSTAAALIVKRNVNHEGHKHNHRHLHHYHHSKQNQQVSHVDKRSDDTEDHAELNMASFRIELDKSDIKNNVTVSKLIIKSLEANHKGLYKCWYDKIEAKYHLELIKQSRDHPKVKYQLINHQQFFSTSASASVSVGSAFMKTVIILLFSWLNFVVLF